MLKSGDSAPDFELPNADLEVSRLGDYRGKNLVIYFYPKDNTPGCTIEAIDFSDQQEEFQQLGTEVVGISRDSCVSHGDFRDKHGLTIQLLADLDGNVCEAFDVWREREAHGKKQRCILRSTFILDGNGIVRYALYDVKPKGHASQILELLRSL